MKNEYFKIVDNAIKYHENRGHILVVEVLKGVRTRMREVALDKMAENARELGLDYLTPDQVAQAVRQLPADVYKSDCMFDKLSPEDRMKPMGLVCLCKKCSPFSGVVK